MLQDEVQALLSHLEHFSISALNDPQAAELLQRGARAAARPAPPKAADVGAAGMGEADNAKMFQSNTHTVDSSGDSSLSCCRCLQTLPAASTAASAWRLCRVRLRAQWKRAVPAAAVPLSTFRSAPGPSGGFGNQHPYVQGPGVALKGLSMCIRRRSLLH